MNKHLWLSVSVFRLPLSWEIGLALTLKVFLLLGLWWLIFHVSERPAVKPDIAKHLLAPAFKQTHSKINLELTHDWR